MTEGMRISREGGGGVRKRLWKSTLEGGSEPKNKSLGELSISSMF